MTLLIFGLVAQAASAASPHFISANAARSGNNLVVTWKEAGLGDNENIDYTASATAKREDSCVNKGGKIPEDPKKTTTQAQNELRGHVQREERVGNGRLTLSPPATTLSCPKAQTATLIRDRRSGGGIARLLFVFSGVSAPALFDSSIGDL